MAECGANAAYFGCVPNELRAVRLLTKLPRKIQTYTDISNCSKKYATKNVKCTRIIK